MSHLENPVIPPFLRTELHTELVCDQGDELAIGGLFFGKCHAAAKGAVECVDASTAPRNFDSVPDGAVKKCKNEPSCGLRPYIYCVLHAYYSILLAWMQIAERWDRGDFRMGIYNLKNPPSYDVLH